MSRLAGPRSSKSPSSGSKGRVFSFNKGLEDARWGSIPATVFFSMFIFMIIFYRHPDYTISKKIFHIALLLLGIFLVNVGFLMWWRTPRTLILTEEALIGKRTWGKDIVLPWTSITSLKRTLFHWKWAGLKVVSKPLRCQFIIGEEIQEFDELVQLLQYHVQRHNPSAQMIGLPEVSVGWQPSPTRSSTELKAPTWLRFEVPPRRRSLRGPLMTVLGGMGLLFGLRQLATTIGPARYAVHLSLLAMIVLISGVLLWLIDWTTKQDP